MCSAWAVRLMYGAWTRECWAEAWRWVNANIPWRPQSFKTTSHVSYCLFFLSLLFSSCLDLSLTYYFFLFFHIVSSLLFISSLLSYVTLDHKTSLKSHRYICSNRQQYIVWVKMIHFSFMPKVSRILSKDHVPWIFFFFFKFPTINISKLKFWWTICIAKKFIWTALKAIVSIFWFFLHPQIPDFQIVACSFLSHNLILSCSVSSCLFSSHLVSFPHMI